MLFLLFSGVPNSGKTTAVRNTYDYLIRRGYVVLAPTVATVAPLDISCVVTNGTRTVIIHSGSDSPDAVDALKNLYRNYPNVDCIISSMRAPYHGARWDPRTYLLNTLQPFSVGNFCIEIPTGKINGNRGFLTKLLLWHHSTVSTIAQYTLSNPPFNL